VEKLARVENTGRWSAASPENQSGAALPSGGHHQIRFPQCCQLHDHGPRSKDAADPERMSKTQG
jgi:hypothetical protein